VLHQCVAAEASTVIVLPSYRGFRIEVIAVEVNNRWDVDVRIRRLFSNEMHIEIVMCGELTPELAERAGKVWAKRWVDLKATKGA
jgi:hypothetical protein